jgi:hypothetical protein
MSEPEKIQYQLRIKLTEEFALAAWSNPDDPRLAPLKQILEANNATIRCQLNEFRDYVAEAEQAIAQAKGDEAREAAREQYNLYAWTKATIEDPAMIKKHTKSYTVFVGGEHLYDEGVADRIRAALLPLKERGMITAVAKHDNIPEHNPQPPPQFQR